MKKGKETDRGGVSFTAGKLSYNRYQTILLPEQNMLWIVANVLG
jgi:hypothetical protein